MTRGIVAPLAGIRSRTRPASSHRRDLPARQRDADFAVALGQEHSGVRPVGLAPAQFTARLSTLTLPESAGPTVKVIGSFPAGRSTGTVTVDQVSQLPVTGSSTC